MQPVIYCAHPISGLSFDEVVAYYLELTRCLRDIGADPIHPMTGKGELRTEKYFRAEGYGNPTSSNHAIFERDMWMVRKADLVLVDLTGAPAISIGCMMELAWASYMGKHTVLVLPDGDNPHRHAFVLEAADVVFPTLDDAVEYIHMFIRQAV